MVRIKQSQLWVGNLKLGFRKFEKEVYGTILCFWKCLDFFFDNTKLKNWDMENLNNKTDMVEPMQIFPFQIF